MDSLDVKLFWKEKIDGYESEDYVSELKFYSSKDGTKIPYTAEEEASDDKEKNDARVPLKLGQIRVERDSKLAKTDWLVTKSVDTGVSMGSSWTTYRQELRDLPNSSGFPHSVTWPTEPSS